MEGGKITDTTLHCYNSRATFRTMRDKRQKFIFEADNEDRSHEKWHFFHTFKKAMVYCMSTHFLTEMITCAPQFNNSAVFTAMVFTAMVLSLSLSN